MIAQAGQRTFIELGRAQAMNEWWHWLALLLVCLILLAFVIMTYRRDSQELPLPMRLLLTLLRLTAFVGLLVFFLQIEKRTEQRITRNSRVSVLVDTSQSMGLRDVDATPGPNGEGQGNLRRIDLVTRSFAEHDLVEKLRQRHDVNVYRFGQAEKPEQVLSVRRGAPQDTETSPAEVFRSSRSEARRLTLIAAFFLIVALGGTVIHFLLLGIGRPTNQGWGLLVAVVAVITAFVVLGVSNLRNPRVGWSQLWGAPMAASTESPAELDVGGTERSGAVEDAAATDWSRELQPNGIKTRLGDALQYVVQRERGGSLAGVVTFSDGNVNSGADPLEVVRSARDAGIPFFNVGLGSDHQPANVRVADVEAPPRVFPGDAFTLTAFVQAFSLSDQPAKIELFSRDTSKSADDEFAEEFVETKQIVLSDDGEALPIDFELTPHEVGRRSYIVRVSGPQNDIDPLDNEQSVNVRIVDRQNRVLMLAGGPMRDYRFLRTQAYRDKEIVVDVLLQSSPTGAAQEADRVLSKFPETPEEMYEYDCVCAFDPDWQQFSAAQLELLEEWVATQAGGLVVIAGPVHTSEWSSRRRSATGLDIIKSLYPVEFYSRSGITLGRGAFEAGEPTPLRFTDEGLAARFLWLGEKADESEVAWAEFAGVYGYQPVKDVKRGATVYARFGNPEAAIDGKLPVFMAGQFYGAGRVFYLGSGEMWRLRAHDTRYFEQFYTRLIRYVSEGRLLRDSSRGVLLLDKDRCTLGETVTIRASLTDSQHQPLRDEQVAAALVLPDGSRQAIKLRRLQEGTRDGVYVNQIVAATEGDYLVELIVPDSERLEVLTRELRVRVPDIEIERPQRNDALLSELSRRTSGEYFVGLDAAIGTSDVPLLCDKILPQDQETYLPGTPDLEFERRLMSWLLGLICGALCLEWLFRRLYKLA